MRVALITCDGRVDQEASEARMASGLCTRNVFHVCWTRACCVPQMRRDERRPCPCGRKVNLQQVDPSQRRQGPDRPPSPHCWDRCLPNPQSPLEASRGRMARGAVRAPETEVLWDVEWVDDGVVIRAWPPPGPSSKSPCSDVCVSRMRNTWSSCRSCGPNGADDQRAL